MPLKLYLVSVDFLQPGDYGSFKERLRTLDARQLLERQWALRSIYTAAYLKDLLRQSVDSGDRIVACNATPACP